MLHALSSIIFSCLILSIETTIGPSSRKSPDRSTRNTVSTQAPPIESTSPSISHGSASLAQNNVLQRNLLEQNADPKLILQNHQSYCLTCVETREFNNPTLVYITPWNPHGYDLVKIFTKKFDYISPVWFNIKRTGLESYIIDGTHDIDKKWIETLKENNSHIRIVPRVIFENWPVDDIHALFQSENEKQQLALTFASFLDEYKQLFDGYVLELLTQFRGASKPTLNHIVSDVAEHVHDIEVDGKKKEIILAVPPYEELFDRNDFQMLYEHIDGFSVMTYDFPNREPGPVAPLGTYLDSNESNLKSVLCSNLSAYIPLKKKSIHYSRYIVTAN